MRFSPNTSDGRNEQSNEVRVLRASLDAFREKVERIININGPDPFELEEGNRVFYDGTTPGERPAHSTLHVARTFDESFEAHWKFVTTNDDNDVRGRGLEVSYDSTKDIWNIVRWKREAIGDNVEVKVQSVDVKNMATGIPTIEGQTARGPDDINGADDKIVVNDKLGPVVAARLATDDLED